MRWSLFSTSPIFTFRFLSISSLLTTSWAAPHNFHESHAQSSPLLATSLSKRSRQSMNTTELIVLAVVAPIILIIACIIVHILVRRYVNNKVDPDPTVVDLRKEYPENLPVTPGLQGSHMREKSATDAERWARLSIAVPPPRGFVRERSGSESGIHPRSLTPGGHRMSSPAPPSPGRFVHERRGSESSIHPRSLTPGGHRMSSPEPPSPRRFVRERRGSEGSIHPPALTPGGRHSTVSGWGRQSFDRNTMRLSLAHSPLEDSDFRISYWYSEPEGRKSVRPLPALPSRAASGPNRYSRRSSYDWDNRRRQSSYDIPSGDSVFLDGSDISKSNSINSKTSLIR